MKMIVMRIMMLACIICLNSCEKEKLFYVGGDIQIEIETGEHWLHDFPLFLGISKKNAPQFAIWIEDIEGNYLSTVFVTSKIATEGWLSNNGNRRREALPYWCYQRGITASDGLLLPTKDNPLADGITGATPKENKTFQLRLETFNEPIVIKAEFNHSVDFNEFFPEDAKEGDVNYSGGDMGSGQPAIIYANIVYPNTENLELEIIGYSSPDGSNGTVFNELEKLSTAKSIVKSIKIDIIQD
jgi:hypothetical protein